MKKYKLVPGKSCSGCCFGRKNYGVYLCDCYFIKKECKYGETVYAEVPNTNGDKIRAMSNEELADGFDAFDSSPLVRIIGPEPEKFESMVRINNGMSTDISVRPMWKKWGAELRIRFDADMFTKTDVLNLLYRVGCQLGICEGRPSSKKSCGMGWGTFDLVHSMEEIEA